MFGMTQPSERARFAIEALLEACSFRARCRKNLQGHNAVEHRLPRLVDRAHAARAEQRLDFQLRKQLRYLGEGRWFEMAALGCRAVLGFHPLSQQATRAQTRQRARWHWLAALRTWRPFNHDGLHNLYSFLEDLRSVFWKVLQTFRTKEKAPFHPLKRGFESIFVSLLQCFLQKLDSLGRNLIASRFHATPDRRRARDHLHVRRERFDHDVAFILDALSALAIGFQSM